MRNWLKIFSIFIIAFWLLVAIEPYRPGSALVPAAKKVLADAGGDFTVIRGTTVISSGQTSNTITNGNEYTLESGQDNTTAFIRIVDARFTGMGRTSSGGNQNTDDFTVRIDNPENIATSITFTRTGSSNDDRIEWEIIQYTGSAGGDNEIVVRGTGDLATSGNTDSVTGSTITTISDIDKAVVFITGQACDSTSRSEWHSCLFTASLVANSSDWDPTFTRGKASSYDGRVSYAVVEFTGSNWADVQRIETSVKPSSEWSPGSDAYEDFSITTLGGSNLSDASKAFLHVQYMTDDDNTGISHAGDTWQLLNTTQLRMRTRYLDNTNTNVIWIIENTQSSGTVMSVEHVYFYDGTTSGSEERSWTQSVGPVSAVDETSIMGETASIDGSVSGTAYPRGAVNLRLSDVDEVTLTESDNGQERHIAFDVVEWPTSAATVVSVNITTDGIVSYGTVSGSQDTVSLSDTQTAQNDGNVTENFSIKGQDTACPWTLASSAGSDQYVHEFSTNSGSSWTPLTTSYQTLASGVATSGTADFDLQITVPTDSSCTDQQSVDVTILAEQQ